jgi:hypothetical protein
MAKSDHSTALPMEAPTMALRTAELDDMAL